MFHRAVITDRLDNLEYMMTFKQGTPQLKVMSEIVRDQGTDINLIENCYRMFQCSTRISESSRQPVKIDVTGGNCAQLNKLVQLLVANPRYGDIDTKLIKTKIRDVFNASCFNTVDTLL